MTITTRELVRRIQGSELLELDELRKSLAAIQVKFNGHLPEDGQAVARDLVGGGVLTKWQAVNLIEGRWQGFFLGKYKLHKPLGRGGMSTVFLAEHVVMRRRIAVKVLPRKFLKKQSNIVRFQQEARTCAMLDHPNIVKVIDFDSIEDRHFMVMEYIDGSDLQVHVRKNGPLPIAQAIEFLRCMTSALQHAHERGIIHRDIKPLNMLITRDGVVKLSDLGLAKIFHDEDPQLTEKKDRVLGTADYIAPEQAKSSKSADGRSDLYSLGCTLFFMLVGKAPFAEGSAAQRIAKHQTMAPPSIRAVRPDCPAEVEEICMRLLSKSPDDRYQTATQLLKACERLGGVTPSSSDPSFAGDGNYESDSPSISDSSHSSIDLGGGMSADPGSVLSGMDASFDDTQGNMVNNSGDSTFPDLSEFGAPAVAVTANAAIPQTLAPSGPPAQVSASPWAAGATQSAVSQPGGAFSAQAPTKSAGNEKRNTQMLFLAVGMAAFTLVFTVVAVLYYAVFREDDGVQRYVKSLEQPRPAIATELNSSNPAPKLNASSESSSAAERDS